MKPEENHDPVWDLLKKAREVDIDPLFSRAVCREVRQMSKDKTEDSGEKVAAEDGGSLISWLFRPAPLIGGLAAAAAVALLVAYGFKSSDNPADTPDPVATVAIDEEEIASLQYVDDIVSKDSVDDLDDQQLLTLLY